ncbi:MAG: PASTA domain-containing protein, partial [Flavobacteriaceae bacterium]|nr:PASTA domain-containing protein [Flavobacteriaceae bacterium]
MKVLKFILTWQFWTSLVSIALIVYAMVWGVFAWLSFYTNHGKQVEVPNVMNISLDQAVQKLEEERLDYEIDTSKYDPQYKPYQILDVYPIIGSNVKEGRRIFIRANAKTWKSVALPNIVGRSKYLAFSQLDLVGLQISDTVYEPNLAVNTVLRVLYKGKEIQPGMMLPRLSGLTLVLGQKLAQNVKVPTLIGLDEAAAANVIKENL